MGERRQEGGDEEMCLMGSCGLLSAAGLPGVARRMLRDEEVKKTAEQPQWHSKGYWQHLQHCVQCEPLLQGRRHSCRVLVQLLN